VRTTDLLWNLDLERRGSLTLSGTSNDGNRGARK